MKDVRRKVNRGREKRNPWKIRLGGTKKKSLSQIEKGQVLASRKSQAAATKKASSAQLQQSSRRTFTVPRLDKTQAQEVLGGLKAITIYNTAKRMGTTASSASALLKSLELKGVIERVGGYSGHYVWRIVETNK